MAAGRQSPLWQSCCHDQITAPWQVNGPICESAIRHRFQAAALSFDATLRFERRVKLS
jgi:hypothetical protein